MPYWNANDVYTDINGTPIKHGDVLKLVDPDELYEPWRYLICYKGEECGPYEGKLQIRDLDANNIGMCSVRDHKGRVYFGANGEVENVGHYSNHPGILDKYDLAYYFGILLPEYFVGF